MYKILALELEESSNFSRLNEMKNILPPESGKYLSVGVELAASFLVSMFVGYAFDQWLGFFPLATVVFSAIGITLGFYNLYLRLKKND